MAIEADIGKILSDSARLNAALHSDGKLLPAILNNTGFLSALLDRQKPEYFTSILGKVAEVEAWDIDRTIKFSHSDGDWHGDAEKLREWLPDYKKKWSDRLMGALIKNPALAYHLKMVKAENLGVLLEKGKAAFAHNSDVMKILGPLLLAWKHGQTVEFNGQGGLNNDFCKKLYARGRALINGAARGNKKTVIALLHMPDVPCFINLADDQSGKTALMWAASNGHIDIVSLLIEKGGKLEEKDARGKTVLMWAAIYGHKDIAALLIEKGAKLDEKDQNDRTPLMLAAMYGHKDIAALLIEKGAKLGEKDQDGLTAQNFAEQRKYQDIVELITQARQDKWLDRIARFGKIAEANEYRHRG